MFLVVEIDDQEILSDLLGRISAQNTGKPVSINPPLDTDEDLLDYDVVYTQYPLEGTEDVSLIRYTDLYMASKGARYWGFDTRKSFATYAGPSPQTRDEIDQIIVDAIYAESRAKLFASFGVNYLGRVFSDPRNVLLIDNKKGSHMHSPKNSNDMDKFLSSITDDWWHDLGIVSSGNVNKLEAFLDQIDYSMPLVYSTSGKSKLKFIGRDFTEIHIPSETDNSDYGISLRERTRPVDL